MNIPVLNIIHIPKDKFDPQSALFTETLKRAHNITSQAYEHKFTYGVWDGIIVQGMPFKGISQSHKQIVQHAKDNGFERCFIAEDDFDLLPNGWKIFMENMPVAFDLYFGGISGGSVNEENNSVTGASGMFFYAIHWTFYDAFLAADEEKNIDRWLSSAEGLTTIEKILGRKPIYKVCYPMVAITTDGVSLKSGEYVQHEKYFSAYKTIG
jgi:hypothetical protein